ncbi:MAG: hypothetical protein WKG00_34660 [Polyangiaceae bacterium]
MERRPPETDETPPSWLTGALRVGTAGLVFGVALARAASSGQWRDDLPALRDIGFVAVGANGGVSTLLTQALGLVPLGGKTFRAALGSVLALALATWLLQGIAHRIVGKLGLGSRLRAALAALAAATAGLSPTWQREATVGGGAMVATACALGVLALALSLAGPERERVVPHGRAWIATGALWGATVAESPPAALAVAFAVAAIFWGDRFAAGVADAARSLWRGRLEERASAPRRPAHGAREVGALLAAALVGLLLFAPLLLRPLAPRAWVDLGRVLSATSLSALDVAGERTTALAAWLREVGVVSLSLSVFGTVVAFSRRGMRPLALPLAALVLADAVAPASLAGMISADPLTSLRSMAVGALAVLATAGVATGVGLLARAKIPMARTAAALSVVFYLTMVALSSEEASFAADRSQQLAAEQWTDEAWLALEPFSAVLVRSPAIAWRLWAARLVRGERPDVLVIPVPLLARGSVAHDLAVTERGIEPLLHAYALRGAPTEFALSKLADVRPLHVEVDQAWSPRLLSHLSLDGMWLEYAPQPLGASDRKAALAVTTGPLGRVLAAVHAGAVPDGATAGVVAAALRDQAGVLAGLGERETAQRFQERIASLGPAEPMVGGGPRFAHAGVASAVAEPRRKR